VTDDARPDDPRPDDPQQAPPDLPDDDAAEQAGGADDRRVSVLRRVPWSPWWRLGAAAAAVGALTWGVSGSDLALRLDDGARADAARTTPGPVEGTFVDSSRLACPGTAPWLGEGTDSRPGVEVLAAGAPRSVLDAVPPRASDDAAVTSSPDDAAVTSAPDHAAGTAASDGAHATSAPGGDATEAEPDDASSTSGPDGDAAGAGSAEVPAEGASVLLSSDGQEGPVELEHGTPVSLRLESATSAVVDATEELAPGVLGGQLGLGVEPGSRGLTVSGCVTPADTQWLVAGGSAPGRAEQLVLTNTGPDAVTVAVSVWGADGPVDTTGASGIVVPGGGRVVELLDGLAPAVDAPVVSVTATGGPVVAHLAESYREGTTDRGTEVVAPVAPPATDLVLPALPAAPEGHEAQVVLRVAAPGEAQAVVDLTALTAEGAVRLADQVTRVPAGSTVDVELTDLPEGATALRLRSDEPVTAGARLEVLPAQDDPEVVKVDPGGADGTEADPDEEGGEGGEEVEQGEPLLRSAGDVAWVGATVPTQTPLGMALPDRSAVSGAAATLALTAVDGTTAWVTWVDQDGAETSRSVPLPNDTTTSVPLPEEARAVWVVGAGPAGVAASVHVTGADDRGPFAASTTLPGLPWLRQLTEVRPLVP
jgi:hypothetical protein